MKNEELDELMNERDELKEQTAQMRKNWILKNRKLSTKQRVSAFVSLIAIVIFVFFALDYVGRAQRAFEEVKSFTPDPLSVADCPGNARAIYWDFTSAETNDMMELRDMGIAKKNFYILCEHVGSGGFMSAFLFKNNKLIFKEEDIYQGEVFNDYDNHFDIVRGVAGACNACPKAYILSRYKFNPKTDSMQLIESKEYPTEMIMSDDSTIYSNKELDAFEQKNKSPFVDCE